MSARPHVSAAADWIEHVLETGGVAYMTAPIPEHIVVRNSLDTYGFAVGCMCVLLLITCKLSHLALAVCCAGLRRDKLKRM
jgi:hypothetical protein